MACTRVNFTFSLLYSALLFDIIIVSYCNENGEMSLSVLEIFSSKKCVDSPDSCGKQTGVMRGGTNGYVILPQRGEILTGAVVPYIDGRGYFFML